MSGPPDRPTRIVVAHLDLCGVIARAYEEWSVLGTATGARSLPEHIGARVMTLSESPVRWRQRAASPRETTPPRP